MFIDVRQPYTGKLLFRYDPNRNLIEIASRGVKTLVDLNKYKAELDQPASLSNCQKLSDSCTLEQ
ncbi:MAG: hypothetical protein P4L50_03325 [Anaerolineaceae bacterium]|nr:hypothetical protein [Anaerolineaceae bacterium]